VNYFYFDVETCPINKEEYLSRTEEERKKLLNPIDSKIVAIGIQINEDVPVICQDASEKKLLEEFWTEMASFRKGDPSNKIVGFNVKDFDLPFVVTRSFINNVTIAPFVLKDIIDIRECISAFKWGPVRGKLKELGEMIGIDIDDEMDGSKVAETYWAGNIDKIIEYLKKDLEITAALHKRANELRIDQIQRW